MDDEERSSEGSPSKDGELNAADATSGVDDAEPTVSLESQPLDDPDLSDGADVDEDAAQPARSRAVPPWLLYALAGLAVIAVLAFILVPRFTEADPYEPLGDEGSPARAVAEALDAQMTCRAGEIGDEHSVLACYQQTADHVTMVFLQSDRGGQVASYTVETQPMGDIPDTGQAISLASQVAAIVTPGADFTGCSHAYGTEYFCFGSLASWESTSVLPTESTGAKQRLPSVDEVGTGLNEQGWDCEYGICVNGETSMNTAQSLTGLGLRFAAPVDIEHVKQAVTELLQGTADTDELQDWVETINGSLNIIVADGFVVGYLPQVGDSGMVVIDEVAGVLPDTA